MRNVPYVEGLPVKRPRFYYPDVKLLIIDLFCGAGGTTLGYEEAFRKLKKLAKVIACVNHDFKAIKSHRRNHKRVMHFNEDIRKLDLTDLIQLVKEWQLRCPNAKLVLWASLECTNHSKAKGGLPKNEDSRTLAWELYRYVEALNPDYIKIENVVEFRQWGPLDDEMQPIKEAKGMFFEGWREHIRGYGYQDAWTEMNAADYGAYTSRNRLFGCFAKEGLPVSFPLPTHCKREKLKKLKRKGQAGGLKPWKAVKKVLDLENVGDSLFALKYIKSRKEWRPRITSDDTYKRVLAGLKRFQHEATPYMVHRHGGTPTSKVMSVEDPSRTITTTGGGIDLVHPIFLTSYYGTGNCNASIETPAPTITTKDRCSLVSLSWIDKQYSGDRNHSSINEPCGSLLTNDKMNLVSCFGYLMVPQWSIDSNHSLENPCPTLLASMEKTETKMVTAVKGPTCLYTDKWDTPIRSELKEYMREHGIADIRIRGLVIPELKQIQGFPVDYELYGSQADQKKFIGNAVHKKVVTAWVKHLVKEL